MHDNVKRSLLNATELDTMLVMRSIGATHRVWSNQAAQECLEFEKSGADLDEVINVVAGDKARRMFEKEISPAAPYPVGRASVWSMTYRQ